MKGRFRRYMRHADERQKQLLGITAILISCVCFATANLFVKLATEHYNGMFVSLFRFIVGGILAVFILRFTGRGFVLHKRKEWLFRGLFGSLSMILFYVGISMTSNGRASLLSGTSPVFVAVFGYFLFNEKIRGYQIIAVLTGIIGAAVVFYDGSSYPLLGNLLCLGSGIAGGIAVNYVRIAREKDNSFILYLSPCLFGIVINAWQFPGFADIRNLYDIALLVVIGFLAFGGQVAMAFAFRYIDATSGRLLGMAEILMSLLLGYLIAAEEMPYRFFIGAAVITSALLVNLYGMSRREKRKG